MAKKEEIVKQVVFTTKMVEDVTRNINDGVVVKRFQNPWFKNEVGVRRSGLAFKMSDDEIQEYIKCKLDIKHFAEKYCKIKTEDGTITNIELREYQKEILDLFSKNRFSILCSSRQIGKTVNTAITILHFLLFNNDKNAMIVANIAATTIEIVDKIKSIYVLLPFFLKVGVKNWNQKSVVFDNGCRIKTAARSKTPAIGFTIDLLYMDEFAHIPSNIIEPYYTAAYPTVSALQNSKIIITSTPNGMNLFWKLLTAAERPEGDPLKNNYKAMRVYWYQVPGRFVTYYRLNPFKMMDLGINKEWILEKIVEKMGENTKVQMKWNIDFEKDIIHVHNNEIITEEISKNFGFTAPSGKEMHISQIAEVSTWKEEAIKDIGGEDAFNQEFGLRFINSSRSLLSESVIEGLMKSKKNYVWEEIPKMENLLNFSYQNLKWIDDPDIFSLQNAKQVHGVISIDISEGLSQDYSVMNIFKISVKDEETILTHKPTYKDISDFYCLEQIGLFRSNIISVKQLSELFYVLTWEVLDPEKFRVVLEINTYGNEFLAHLPHVFDGNNNYGNNIFFRYKHRADALEEKIGLKLGDNKNLLVKDYQDNMNKKNILINNEDNIREITTFVKQTTSFGNVRYAADVGNDDIVMTVVNSSSVFEKHPFKEMIEDVAQSLAGSERWKYFNDILGSVTDSQTINYTSIINKHRQQKDALRKMSGYEKSPWSRD